MPKHKGERGLKKTKMASSVNDCSDGKRKRSSLKKGTVKKKTQKVKEKCLDSEINEEDKWDNAFEYVNM